MKINTYIKIGLTGVCLVGVIAYQAIAIHKIKAESIVYQNNTTALLSDVERLQLDSTTSAIQINTLKLSLDEYKQYRAEDVELIKRLGVKLKDVQSSSKTTVEVDVPIQTIITHDTIYKDSASHYIQSVQYKNDYIQFDGQIVKDSLTAKINVPITLHQTLYKIPKHKFLWWSWGCKQVKQIISCDNPYVNIKYSEFIEINK